MLHDRGAAESRVLPASCMGPRDSIFVKVPHPSVPDISLSLQPGVVHDWVPGSYLRIIGNFKIFNEHRSVMAYHVKPVLDHNEVSTMLFIGVQTGTNASLYCVQLAVSVHCLSVVPCHLYTI